MDTNADRKPLDNKSFLTAHPSSGAPEPPRPDLEALQGLLDSANRDSTPYQSVAVAAVQTLERALRHERQVAEAALSLGQQEKIGSLVQMADKAVALLRDTLSAQGHKVMHVHASSGKADAAEAASPSWRPVLAAALEVLEEGTDQMGSLTTGQPSGSPARELSRFIAQFLRSHHDVLLMEAEDWSD
jgi:hypothetical protein